MELQSTIMPTGPYALLRSAATGACPTRRIAGGVLHLALDTAQGAASARVAQRADGALLVHLDAPDPESAMPVLRATLAVDVDLRPFTAMVADDPVLGPRTRRHRGMRPLPLMSPSHALLRGIAGQLVQQRDARRMEFAGVRAVGRPVGALWAPLRRDELRAVPVPVLQRAGMAERRAVLVRRAAAALDLDGLHRLPTDEVVRRLCAHPGIGPWTAGVVCTLGLGRLDHGLVGDLGLVRMMALREGRVVEAEETASLLEPWAPYQALASAYLLYGGVGGKLPASPITVARFARRGPRG
ncbi:MAG: hypothetical protein U0Y82_00280 [Thermoleophilia bacterium]